MKKFALLLIPFLAFASCKKDADTTIDNRSDSGDDPEAVDGVLTGRFSVGPNTQVLFSKGNLQYLASTAVWRFAEHQYDMVGEVNAGVAPDYTEWIDLFGFGTSGYDGTVPYASQDDYSEYYGGMEDIAGTEFDWGVHNAISNGGNKAGLWRTLTKPEWGYLLEERTGASQKVSLATVCGVKGAVLLPDDWKLPESCSFTATTQNFAINNYSESQWKQMESAGAVFLPNAGARLYGRLEFIGEGGFYWSSSYYNTTYASFLGVQEGAVKLYDNFRIMGLSVRLVKNVE